MMNSLRVTQMFSPTGRAGIARNLVLKGSGLDQPLARYTFRACPERQGGTTPLRPTFMHAYARARANQGVT